MDDRVRTIADGVKPGEYGRRQAFQVHKALREKGPVTVPREFVLMDRAAIGLGGVFLHLRAELNFYRLFNEAIEDFSVERVAAAAGQGAQRRRARRVRLSSFGRCSTIADARSSSAAMRCIDRTRASRNPPSIRAGRKHNDNTTRTDDNARRRRSACRHANDRACADAGAANRPRQGERRRSPDSISSISICSKRRRARRSRRDVSLSSMAPAISGRCVRTGAPSTTFRFCARRLQGVDQQSICAPS